MRKQPNSILNPFCPFCGKTMDKNPKHAESIWECVNCGKTWLIINTSSKKKPIVPFPFPVKE